MVGGRVHEDWVALSRIELQKAKVRRTKGPEKRVAEFLLTAMLNRVRVEDGKKPLPIPPI